MVLLRDVNHSFYVTNGAVIKGPTFPFFGDFFFSDLHITFTEVKC